MKKAFTLIEVIFTLVVLGIVATIGAEVIFQIYSNYIYSQALSDTMYRLELAAESLEKRLMHRIPLSEVASKTTNIYDIKALTYDNTAYDILEWVGIAYEARRGEFNTTYNYAIPGWSGFVDLERSTKEYLVTPGSDLFSTKRILQAVYDRNLSAPNSGIAVAFAILQADPIRAYGWTKFYDPTNPHSNIFLVNIQNKSDTLYFNDTTSKTIYEHYYLCASAYAIVPQQNGDKYDLLLYSNFTPWKEESFQDGNSSLLIKNISRFKFKRNGRGVEFMLCAKADPKYELNATFCVKKVVF